jgi:hypothetical protein
VFSNDRSPVYSASSQGHLEGQEWVGLTHSPSR